MAAMETYCEIQIECAGCNTRLSGTAAAGGGGSGGGSAAASATAKVQSMVSKVVEQARRKGMKKEKGSKRRREDVLSGVTGTPKKKKSRISLSLTDEEALALASHGAHTDSDSSDASDPLPPAALPVVNALITAHPVERPPAFWVPAYLCVRRVYRAIC